MEITLGSVERHAHKLTLGIYSDCTFPIRDAFAGNE